MCTCLATSGGSSIWADIFRWDLESCMIVYAISIFSAAPPCRLSGMRDALYASCVTERRSGPIFFSFHIDSGERVWWVEYWKDAAVVLHVSVGFRGRIQVNNFCRSILQLLHINESSSTPQP